MGDSSSLALVHKVNKPCGGRELLMKKCRLFLYLKVMVFPCSAQQMLFITDGVWWDADVCVAKGLCPRVCTCFFYLWMQACAKLN